MASYYFPEGAFGPICDLAATDDEIKRLARPAIDLDDGDGSSFQYGITTGIYDGIFPDNKPTFYDRTNCKERILPDGTVQLYDCVDEFTGDLPETDDRFKDAARTIGLKDIFFVPKLGPESCSPYKSDINIRSQKFYTSDGTKVTRTPIEGSSPVTYPVTSQNQSIPNNATITATFDSSSSNLVIGGTGTGIVQMRLQWDDNPNKYGTAVSTITVNGVTFTQTSGVEEGDQSESFKVTAGTSYPITYTGLNSANNPIVQNGNTELCLKDADGSDCNARFTITDVLPETTTTNIAGYWSDEGNKYGVWVNPAICTLPELTQTVTYKIPIETAGTYGFTFGCDDNATLTIGDETSPLITAVGGIFAGGSYNTPYTATRTLSAGTLLLTVSCTNSDAGFQDSDGNPTGLAYSWQRNPGGWYIKICRGGLCESGTNVTWVQSGEHPLWSDFMNEYAVFPSAADPLLDQAQTATYNITVPKTGNYNLETQADNSATFTLDGTLVATSTSFTTSVNTTLSNLSEGPHSLVVSVTNNTSANAANTWTDNPGGAAWKLTSGASNSNIGASFASNGDLVVTGDGVATIDLEFEWDDSSSYGRALGSVRFRKPNGSILDGGEYSSDNGIFIQSSSETGSDTDTVTVQGGTTYKAVILSNPNGFTVKDNGNKLCFFDADGNDCNAEIVIGTITQKSTEIASSLDLNTPGDGNLYWHTRKATGYTYLED